MTMGVIYEIAPFKYGEPMAVWDASDELTHPEDYLLIQNGFVIMFHSRENLKISTDWLHSHGYHIAYVDTSEWGHIDDIHEPFAKALNYRVRYGRNISAIDDCLSDIAVKDYAWPEGATGLVVVVDGFAEYVAEAPQSAQYLIESFERQAAHAALFGNRMMFLIRSSNPNLQMDNVGGRSVMWVYREFLTSSRQPK